MMLKIALLQMRGKEMPTDIPRNMGSSWVEKQRPRLSGRMNEAQSSFYGFGY